MIIIADTSCIILLDNIGELNILQQLFGEIIITSTIAQEFGKSLPQWVTVKDPSDISKISLLLPTVDMGEATAIALAMEIKNSILILDDDRARKLAMTMGLKITGTLGVILDAKKQNKINSIKPILEKIRKTNFRLSDAVFNTTLKMAGE